MEISYPLFLLLILSIIIPGTVLVHANPSLNMIVETDKPEYNPSDIVQVYGNLTMDGVLVTDGLVGIEIQTSSARLVVRTLPAVQPPWETPYIFSEYVAPCDIDGNPTFSFQRNTFAYYKVSLANLNLFQSYEVLVTVNVYDNDSTPLESSGFNTVIPKNSTLLVRLNMLIPIDAVLGTATVYANAYTDWPSLAGTPYCREVNATFEIVDGAYGAGQPTQNQSTNLQSSETTNYNTTFKLAANPTLGLYTVYVTSSYQQEFASDSTTFIVGHLLPPKVGDLGGGIPPQFFQFDGKVDGKDLSLFLQCFKGTAPPEAMYLGDLGGGVPPQFFNYDGKVDGKDLSLFLQCFKGLGPDS
jgi:hypothetical protein